MTKETGGPAFPNEGGSGHLSHHKGITLRQYAAIKLKVPDSGTDWLDEMIAKSLRDDFAAQAMAGYLTGDSAIVIMQAALAQQTEQGWKPIETAPKDGTIVLLHGGRTTTAGSYQPADKNHPWVFLDDAEPDRVNHWQANGPTYWMPLPEFKETK